MADPADVNVDELRRRARRRLVGAIVLALAAAVFVPMLLESDPKPLGEDVSVRIPPVDDGKFVNRLNDTSKAPSGKTTAPKNDARSEVKPESKAETAKAEPPKIEAPKVETPKVDVPKAAEPAKAEPPKVETPKVETPKVETLKVETLKVETPKAEIPKVEMPKAEMVTGAPASETKSAAPAQSLAPPAATAPVVAAAPNSPRAQSEPLLSGFSVQLAAFSDAYGANSLTNKLKKAGYPAYTEPLATNKGTLWRVRVGPYPSRDAAASSRDKLKGDGYSGIVATAK
jgi:DedD protein